MALAPQLADSATVPLTTLVVMEAWQAYERGLASTPSVSDFVAWLTENEPQIFRFVKEPQVIAIAEGLMRDQRAG